jgi:hypothetical protein
MNSDPIGNGLTATYDAQLSKEFTLLSGRAGTACIRAISAMTCGNEEIRAGPVGARGTHS